MSLSTRPVSLTSRNTNKQTAVRFWSFWTKWFVLSAWSFPLFANSPRPQMAKLFQWTSNPSPHTPFRSNPGRPQWLWFKPLLTGYIFTHTRDVYLYICIYMHAHKHTHKCLTLAHIWVFMLFLVPRKCYETLERLWHFRLRHSSSGFCLRFQALSSSYTSPMVSGKTSLL